MGVVKTSQMIKMLIIDNINELDLCIRMFEVLKKQTYSVPQISSLLGLSMYSGHLYKMPLFSKLINEGVFKIFSNSKPVIYEFNPEKLAKTIENSDIFIKLRKVLKIRGIVRDEL